MKKGFIAVCTVVLSCLAIDSYATSTYFETDVESSETYTSRRYSARESDGTEYGYVILRSDGTYVMSVDDDFYSGNYYIDADSYQPGATYPIIFYVDGQPYRGNIVWALDGDEGIGFSGVWFDRDR